MFTNTRVHVDPYVYAYIKRSMHMYIHTWKLEKKYKMWGCMGSLNCNSSLWESQSHCQHHTESLFSMSHRRLSLGTQRNMELGWHVTWTLREAEAGRSWVWGQPRLHGQVLSNETKQKVCGVVRSYLTSGLGDWVRKVENLRPAWASKWDLSQKPKNKQTTRAKWNNFKSLWYSGKIVR